MPTIIIEKNVMVPMRDGVQLATDVYGLADAAPTPVLMARTPYNKDGILAGGDTFDVMRTVQAGYAVVAQDVRGRYVSKGEFNPQIQETADGVDAFAWAAAQPWSNGRIGTFGGSYLGGTQWLPAREQPPALQAMAPCVTFSDCYEGCSYQGGAKMLHDLRWVVANIVPAEMERRAAWDTDFTGKLVDVYPDGRAIILTEGILRARYRNSFTDPKLLEPDEIYEIRLDLWATANVFLAGHRIRLEVSSSNFPRFDRNSNTGGDIVNETADQYRPAINRIFHDAAHPFRLILPIIERRVR